MTALEISLPMLFLSGLLVFGSMLLSWRLQLGMERDMLWGAVRTFVQLSLVGYILTVLFARQNWYLVMLALLIMLAVAVHTAHGRVSSQLPGKVWIFALAIPCGSLLVLSFVSGLVLHISPWYDARYLLPLAGMIIGNAMTAASLAVERFSSALRQRRGEVEAALALGASVGQAVAALRKEALRLAIIPAVNSMLVVGLVSLPGMMTGQIIAGSDPAQAVRYQIVVVYMILAASLLSSVIAVLASLRSSFTPAQQLRWTKER